MTLPLLIALLVGSCSNARRVYNNCANPADISITVGRQAYYLADCGGVINRPVQAIELHPGQTVTVRVVNHETSGPVLLRSSQPAVVSVAGKRIKALQPGTALLTISGIQCLFPEAGGVCDLLSVTVA